MWIITAQIIFQGEEKFFRNIKQLTFVGENAEAYFSPGGDKIVFQSKGEGGIYFVGDSVYIKLLREKGFKFFTVPRGKRFVFFVPEIYNVSSLGFKVDTFFVKKKYNCDQIFVMDTSGYPIKKVSPGGINTCGWFLDNHRILFSSTFKYGNGCPKNPYAKEYLRKGIYVWSLFNYDLFIYDMDKDSIYEVFSSEGYDAEGEGNYGDIVVFTSSKDNDLELYTLDLKTGKVVRITNFPGYDGGAMFSPSGRYIVFRAYHLKSKRDIREFKGFLEKNLVKPENVEIFVYDRKTNKFSQITHSPPGVSNFAPYFHPSEKFIVFSSNMHKPGSFNFELYKVDIDGKNLQRITFSGGFNAFPMFRKDGRKIIWTSSRGVKGKREFNIFMADWIE